MFDELVAGMLQVVLVDGIVHHPLHVALIVPNLEIESEIIMADRQISSCASTRMSSEKVHPFGVRAFF